MLAVGTPFVVGVLEIIKPVEITTLDILILLNGIVENVMANSSDGDIFVEVMTDKLLLTSPVIEGVTVLVFIEAGVLLK